MKLKDARIADTAQEQLMFSSAVIAVRFSAGIVRWKASVPRHRTMIVAPAAAAQAGLQSVKTKNVIFQTF